MHFPNSQQSKRAQNYVAATIKLLGLVALAPFDALFECPIGVLDLTRICSAIHKNGAAECGRKIGTVNLDSFVRTSVSAGV